MATPTDRYYMKVDGFLSHPCSYTDMVSLDTILPAAPTRLSVNPVHIFLLTCHSDHFIIQGSDKQP